MRRRRSTCLDGLLGFEHKVEVHFGTAVLLALIWHYQARLHAEHGIGVAKTQWLAELKGGAAMAAMHAMKHALDPDGLYNPGVILA